MAHTFTVTITGNPADALQRARAEILRGGGEFSGDAAAGTFGGSVPVLGLVRGRYAVAGQQVTIEITRKPMLVPASAIESKVRAYFASAKHSPG